MSITQTERRAVWWAKFYAEGRHEQSFTLRARAGEKTHAFFGRVQDFEKKLINAGYTRAVELPPKQNQAPPRQAAPEAPEPLKSTSASNVYDGARGEPTGEIVIESITLGNGGAHPRWVIKGGKYKKHGITCWPEILKGAGIPPEKLDPMDTNVPKVPLRAWFTEKPSEDGSKMVPDEVVHIERVTAQVTNT